MKLQRGARLNEFTEQRGAKVLRHVLVTKALPVPPASLSTAIIVYIILVTFYSSIYLYSLQQIVYKHIFITIWVVHFILIQCNSKHNTETFVLHLSQVGA